MTLPAYADSDAVGSWYIPFSGDNSSSYSSVSSYVACDGVHQRAVTHSDARTDLTAVPLQWTPSHAFHGTVILTATIVSNYSHYWTHVQSVPVTVRGADTDMTETTSVPSPATVSAGEGEKTLWSSTVHSENVLNDSELLELLSEVIKSKTSETDVSVTTIKNINQNNYIEPSPGIDRNIDIHLLNSSRGRSPRFENQHLYEKIEAEHGAWENSGHTAVLHSVLLTFFILSELYKFH